MFLVVLKLRVHACCIVLFKKRKLLSTGKDTHLEGTGQMKTTKYLRQSCYHRIEFFAANSLTALM